MKPWAIMFIVLFFSQSFGQSSSPNEELVLAAEQGDLSKVKDLIASGISLNSSGYRGITALGMAALYERIDIVPFLINQGADPNVEFNDGETALMYAAGNDNPGILHLLLSAGANINAKAKDGCTALFYASMLNQIGNIDILMKAGANIEERENEFQGTPLFFARGLLNSITSLLDWGADINARDKDGNTVLMLAAKVGDTETVKVLLQRGAAITISNFDGFTALTVAKKNHQKEIVKMILEAKLNPSAPRQP